MQENKRDEELAQDLCVKALRTAVIATSSHLNRLVVDALSPTYHGSEPESGDRGRWRVIHRQAKTLAAMTASMEVLLEEGREDDALMGAAADNVSPAFTREEGPEGPGKLPTMINGVPVEVRARWLHPSNPSNTMAMVTVGEMDMTCDGRSAKALFVDCGDSMPVCEMLFQALTEWDLKDRLHAIETCIRENDCRIVVDEDLVLLDVGVPGTRARTRFVLFRVRTWRELEVELEKRVSNAGRMVSGAVVEGGESHEALFCHVLMAGPFNRLGGGGMGYQVVATMVRDWAAANLSPLHPALRLIQLKEGYGQQSNERRFDDRAVVVISRFVGEGFAERFSSALSVSDVRLVRHLSFVIREIVDEVYVESRISRLGSPSVEMREKEHMVQLVWRWCGQRVVLQISTDHDHRNIVYMWYSTVGLDVGSMDGSIVPLVNEFSSDIECLRDALIGLTWVVGSDGGDGHHG